MNKPIHPAVAEHAMEENEKLRGLLRDIGNGCGRRDMPSEQVIAEWADRIEAALSQQAELTGPGLAFALTGGRHGEPDEPAPAQDEQCDTCHGQGEIWTGETAYQGYFQPPEPVMDTCPECSGESITRPAQTEQQPVSWQFYQDGKWWNGDDRIKDHRKNTEAAGMPVRDLYADPIAQTAPQTAAKMPCGTAVTNAYEAYEAGKRAAAPKPEKSVPEELFDGHAVYQETVRHRRDSGLLVRTSPENVSDTLDAVVRLIKARRAALSAQGVSDE